MSMERDDLMDPNVEGADASGRDPNAADAATTLPPPPSGTSTTTTDPDGEASGDERVPLLADTGASSFRTRWEEIQVRFVDEPRTAVEDADQLVTEVIGQLQASFTSERDRLEGHWQQGGDVSTEDLRIVLRRYRSFFDRLLAA